ncbi:MAG TPA: DEAD/DEAH box helicase [Kiritimatiellia bacterium]|nr:DEAD/DEAH box helicase [Kiritimatiellia bacterium]
MVHPLLQHAVADQKYLTPTPIQEKSIPHLIEGRDLLGCAQTGTGKTAAFLLPILHRLTLNPKEALRNKPRALIVAPTRELAAQIATSTAAYGRYLGLPFAVVFGGVSQYPQVNALNRGAVLVVATPGRLLDLMEQGHVSLEHVEEFVLDEADRMLDMGFLPDIKRILAKLPEERHTQFFSATLSPDVMRLAASMVKDPVSITISPDKPTVDKINQKIMFVDKPNKDSLLIHLLTRHPEMTKVLVFARTRRGSDRIERKLQQAGIRTETIHSDKTQRARTDAMNAFRDGRVRVLVATDIASRGIDVDGITHVVNVDLPEETDSYVHRIGRTARAGADGVALSFVSAEERGLLRAIERVIKKSIEIDNDHEFHSEKAEKAAGKGGSDSLPQPSWVKNNTRRSGKHPATAGHSRRPGSFRGRNQPDFRIRNAKTTGRPEHPLPSRHGQTLGQERPPQVKAAHADSPKHFSHPPADMHKPRSGKPHTGQGHRNEGNRTKSGFKGGKPKKRFSRPPWMT